MRVYIHTSIWAVWAARISRPVVPLLLLGWALHFIGYVSSSVFVAIIIAAIILSLLSMLCALVAFVRIWYNGDAGWRTAFSGLLFGLSAIVFMAAVGYLDTRYPRVADVTTSEIEIALAPTRTGLTTTPSLVDENIFPNAQTRIYQTSSLTVREIIGNVSTSLGWSTKGEQQIGAAETLFFFEAKTLLGFVDDVSLRVRETQKNVIIDVRSASRFGESDLGTNGKRISGFLAQVDAAVEDARGVETVAEGTEETEEPTN